VNIDFTERYLREEGSLRTFWSFNKKVGAIIAALVFVFILFNTTGCSQNQKEQVMQEEDLPRNSINVGDDGVNAAIAPDGEDRILEPKQAENNEKNMDNDKISMVAMSVEDAGRSDPFMPYNEKYASPRARANYDLLPPPETITVDTSASEIIGTKVSGIMYDNYNPSAIIKISGSDYLVRSGDVVNGYKVLSISKNSVTVQNGANIYKAGVGEMFASGNLNFNTVSNLEGKFGGSKNVANKK